MQVIRLNITSVMHCKTPEHNDNNSNEKNNNNNNGEITFHSHLELQQMDNMFCVQYSFD